MVKHTVLEMFLKKVKITIQYWSTILNCIYIQIKIKINKIYICIKDNKHNVIK
jgi:hypothetical protein